MNQTTRKSVNMTTDYDVARSQATSQTPEFRCLTNPSEGMLTLPIAISQLFERSDLTAVLGNNISKKMEPDASLATHQKLGRITAFEGNAPTPSAPAPMPLTIRLRIIYTTDDKGLTDNNPAPTKAALLPMFTTLVESMRQDWADTGINFLFLPDCDFEIRKDSRLNSDFTLPADVFKTFPAKKETYILEQINQLFAKYSNTEYRNKVAAERPNTLLWLVCEPNTIVFDEKTNKWQYWPHVPGSWSAGDVDFVILNKWDFAKSVQHNHEDASRAAHETGHFLHLSHTHQELGEADVSSDPIPTDPTTRLKRWKKGLESWINAKTSKNSTPAQALQVYDRDRDCGVTDTPADPGPGLLGLANLVAGGTEDPLGVVSAVTINPSNVTGPMIFQPDRNNPMSYYLDGKLDTPMKFSLGQTGVMRAALINDNRRRLVGAQLGDTNEPSVRICAVWSPNAKGQGYSWGLTMDALKAKHTEMQGKQFHLSYQCAYVKNGAVLYDAFWDEGVRPQYILWGWLDKDVLTEVKTRANQGWQVIHIQACRHPGTGLRYNVIFEQGTNAQQVLLNATQAQLDQAWQTFMPTGMRLRHLDATINQVGQVRYAALFVPGSQQQHYVAGWTLADIAADYDQQWKLNRKLSAISVVWTADGPRYSAIWNPDNQGQLVMWLHVRERIRELYDEMWCQGFKLRAIHTLTT